MDYEQDENGGAHNIEKPAGFENGDHAMDFQDGPPVKRPPSQGDAPRDFHGKIFTCFSTLCEAELVQKTLKLSFFFQETITSVKKKVVTEWVVSMNLFRSVAEGVCYVLPGRGPREGSEEASEAVLPEASMEVPGQEVLVLCLVQDLALEMVLLQ